MEKENKLNKYIEDNINLLCSDWQPQDNLKMRRVLNKSKKDFLIHQIIEPLLDQQKEEIKKVIKKQLENNTYSDCCNATCKNVCENFLKAIENLCPKTNQKP